MKASTLVESQITVVVDDYDTGEVLYEGTVHGDYVMGMHVSDYPKGIEWVLKDGKPVALVTIEFGDKLAEYKRLVETRKAYDAFVAEPVYAGLSREEQEALMDERKPIHKRLWHEYFIAQATFEGWEPIEE